MRATLYLLSLLLALPGVLAALAVQALMEAIAQPNLLEAFFFVVRRMALGVTWHLWGALAVLALLTGLAFFPAHRWVGAGVISLAALVSTIYLLVQIGLPPEFGQTVLYWGGLLALGITVWLLATDPLVPWRRGEPHDVPLESTGGPSLP